MEPTCGSLNKITIQKLVIFLKEFLVIYCFIFINLQHGKPEEKGVFFNQKFDLEFQKHMIKNFRSMQQSKTGYKKTPVQQNGQLLKSSNGKLTSLIIRFSFCYVFLLIGILGPRAPQDSSAARSSGKLPCQQLKYLSWKANMPLKRGRTQFEQSTNQVKTTKHHQFNSYAHGMQRVPIIKQGLHLEA